MTTTASLEIHGFTDAGRVRERNEDALFWNSSQGLAVIADGMGGHNAGHVASRMAVRAIRDALDPGNAGKRRAAAGPAGIQRAILAANRAIFEAGSRDDECTGMGTTVALARLGGRSMIIAHVGDSRLYRLRGARFTQLMEDHSFLQEARRQGWLTAEEGRRSQFRNVITRALGLAPEVKPDVKRLPVRAGDVYLLCTDGLTDMVGDTVIAETISGARHDLSLASRRLVDLANARGGADNISVILIRVHDVPEVRRSRSRRTARPRQLRRPTAGGSYG